MTTKTTLIPPYFRATLPLINMIISELTDKIEIGYFEFDSQTPYYYKHKRKSNTNPHQS